MSLALDPVLAARMTGQSRRPLVEIISRETLASIPFDGSLLGSGGLNEQSPASILHSSGRICHIDSYGNPASPWYLRYRVSDVNKTEFAVVDIPVEDLVLDVSLTERPDLSIGVVYRCRQVMRYLVLTVSGETVATGIIRRRGQRIQPGAHERLPLVKRRFRGDLGGGRQGHGLHGIQGGGEARFGRSEDGDIHAPPL